MISPEKVLVSTGLMVSLDARIATGMRRKKPASLVLCSRHSPASLRRVEGQPNQLTDISVSTRLTGSPRLCLLLRRYAHYLLELLVLKRRSERLHSSGKHHLRVFAGAAEDERTEVFVPLAVRSERLGGDPGAHSFEVVERHSPFGNSFEDMLPERARQVNESDLRQSRRSRRWPGSVLRLLRSSCQGRRRRGTVRKPLPAWRAPPIRLRRRVRQG